MIFYFLFITVLSMLNKVDNGSKDNPTSSSFALTSNFTF